MVKRYDTKDVTHIPAAVNSIEHQLTFQRVKVRDNMRRCIIARHFSFRVLDEGLSAMFDQKLYHLQVARGGSIVERGVVFQTFGVNISPPLH